MRYLTPQAARKESHDCARPRVAHGWRLREAVALVLREGNRVRLAVRSQNVSYFSYGSLPIWTLDLPAWIEC